jgi:SAM-dependent methyltransferase
MIDEASFAGPEHLDAMFVAAYDRKQGYPDAGEDVAVFAEHGLTEDSRLVDYGAGTGRFALAAARRFGHVTAVDVSTAMLMLLRERADAAGVPNLRAVRAGFLTYEHVGPSVDGVYSRNALHHLPDFWKGIALDRVARIMRPGGVLRIHDLIYDLQPSGADEVLDRWLDRAPDDPALGYIRDDLAEHIRTEFSTYRWLFEPLLAAAGFRIVTAEYRERVFGTYTCLKR